MRGQMMDLVGRPGRYEGLGVFEAWLCEHVDEVSEGDDGNVESPTGWFALCGRRIVSIDSRGFYGVSHCGTREAAADVFEQLEHAYTLWEMVA